jgi:uncharacterized protein
MTKKPQGFAAISKELVKEIASKGGVAAHAKGVAHEFNSAEAKAAGRKGGRTAHANRKAREMSDALRALDSGDKSVETDAQRALDDSANDD